MDVFIAWAIIILIVFLVRKSKPKNRPDTQSAQQQAPVAYNMANPNVATLIDEAIGVINDYLNAGRSMSIFCDHNVVDFSGAVFALLQTKPSSSGPRYSFSIHYLNTSDPQTLATSCPAVRRNPKNADITQQMDSFLVKYGNCYQTNHQYVYHTRNELGPGTGADLLELLYEEIQKRCPLAEVQGTIIYNRNVYH